MKIELKVLDNKVRNNLAYATDGSAALDLIACADNDFGFSIRPGDTMKIKTGIAIHINDVGVGALILPRSGLGSKGIVLANTIGLIDSDYQGEIIVALKNTNRIGSHIVSDRERIAQMIFVPILHPLLTEVKEFSTVSERGSGGFGSTGK